MPDGQVIAWKPLGQLLVERDLLTTGQLDEALARQAQTGGLLGAVLVEDGVVSAPVLTAILAEQAGVVWKPLGELLVERGLLTESELEQALAQQLETGERLGSILVERRVVAGAVLAAILAEQAGSELEREAGFGTGLFAKLSQRRQLGDAARRPSQRRPAAVAPDPEPSGGEQEEDPAFEIVRLRSELELERARVAALERELAELQARRSRRRVVS